MFFKGRPLGPGSLIILIVTVTAAPLVTLLWLGWRLLEQDRILERQNAQERVERAADLAVAALQRALASSEQRLSAGVVDWAEGAVAVTFRMDRAEAIPKDRIAYLPVARSLPEAATEVFEHGEQFEFQKQDYRAAIEIFRDLTNSSVAAIRAGALLRLGRNLARAGRIDEALAAYERLTILDGAAIGGAPASLAGRYARCDLLERTNRPTELRVEGQRFANELASSRWTLTGPVYWLYAADVARWNGGAPGKRESELFAEAAEWIWERRQSLRQTGREIVPIGGQKFAVLWQHSEDTLRSLIAAPDFVQQHWLAATESISREQRVQFAIDDAELRAGIRPAAHRTAKQTELPWDIWIASKATEGAGEFASRRRLLISGFLVLVGMAVIASYVIIRADLPLLLFTASVISHDTGADLTLPAPARRAAISSEPTRAPTAADDCEGLSAARQPISEGVG